MAVSARKKIGREKGEGGREQNLTPLVFINKCFILKWQISLAPGDGHWAVKKAIDRMWETGTMRNEHQFQVFLCTRGRDPRVFPGDGVDGRQTQFCWHLMGQPGGSGLQEMSSTSRGLSSLIDPSCSKAAQGNQGARGPTCTWGPTTPARS